MFYYLSKASYIICTKFNKKLSIYNIFGYSFHLLPPLTGGGPAHASVRTWLCQIFRTRITLILSTLLLACTLPWPLPWNLVPFGSTPFAAKCTIRRQFMAHLLCNCRIVCLHLFQILSAANTEVNTIERNASVRELRPLFAAQGCLLTQSQAKNKPGTRCGRRG